MEKVDIVIACTNGRNRSRLLKDYLLEKGFRSYTIGVNTKSSTAERRLRNARVVISVHEEVNEKLAEMADLEGKTFITLDIEELTANSVQGKRLDGEAWLRHRDEEMIPEMKRQMKKHLAKLETQSMRVPA